MASALQKSSYVTVATRDDIELRYPKGPWTNYPERKVQCLDPAQALPAGNLKEPSRNINFVESPTITNRTSLPSTTPYHLCLKKATRELLILINPLPLGWTVLACSNFESSFAYTYRGRTHTPHVLPTHRSCIQGRRG